MNRPVRHSHDDFVLAHVPRITAARIAVAGFCSGNDIIATVPSAKTPQRAELFEPRRTVNAKSKASASPTVPSSTRIWSTSLCAAPALTFGWVSIDECSQRRCSIRCGAYAHSNEPIPCPKNGASSQAATELIHNSNLDEIELTKLSWNMPTR